MENKNTQNFDVLKDLEISLDEALNVALEESNKNIESENNILIGEKLIENPSMNIDYLDNQYEVETINIFQTENIKQNEEVEEQTSMDIIEVLDEEKKENKTSIIKKKNKLIISLIFLAKYTITSAFIFAVLLVTTNYSAYLNIAKNYIFKGEMQETSQKLISSVEASNIKEKYSTEKMNENQEDVDSNLSITQLKKEQDKENVDFNIQITPYENRIVIPKIGKNIPLLDIKNRNIEGQKELNDIFMKELENGVIRYPGSSKPGEEGISFIFGHSSNFPWIKGDYNDVFALLDKVVFDDEVIVYYNQKKYIYKIKEKKVISPGNVSVLNRNKSKSEISLMTCRPIGTTLNRLIITGELIEEE